MALRLLDAMIPLRAAEAGAKPRRSVFVYIPNGVNGMTWQVTKPGRGYEMSAALKPTHRNEFKQLFDDNFPADDTLQLSAPALTARLTDNQNIPMVAYGCSGTRITIEPDAPFDGFRKGTILRLFAPGWPVATTPKD